VTSDKFPPFRPAAKAIFSDGVTTEGHTVDWLLQSGDGETASGLMRYRGGIAHIAPTYSGSTRVGRLRKYWRDFRNDLRIFALIRRRDYSLIQIKDKYLGALVALLAGRLYSVPVFYWLAYPHAEASLYAADTGVARYALPYRLRGVVQKWLLYRVILPSAVHVFVQSEQMRTDLVSEGIPAAKMTPVPSSINFADLDSGPSIEEGRIFTDDRTIVYLGTLLRERRLDFLVNVLVKARARLPGVKLVFVGRGEMREDEDFLWREAERLGVADAMHITGWLPKEVAWEQVRRAGVCVSPYFPVPILRSTSPTKLVEYMALGKPVVANDHPEQSAVILCSRAGLLCPWDTTEFADAIVSILESPATATSMGLAGRHFVLENRTHSRMVRLVIDRYLAVLAGLSGVGGGGANTFTDVGGHGALERTWSKADTSAARAVRKHSRA
jgi:glycosyltransferase involved in cell wall biosynthesis